MAKEKKTSFTYFLNTRLKPQLIKGEEKYPVYLRITFNRKQAEFRNFLDEEKSLYWSESEIEAFNKRRSLNKAIGIENILLNNEVILTSIIEKEYQKDPDDLDLKGLSKKLFFQNSTIISHLYDTFRSSFELECQFVLAPTRYKTLNFVDPMKALFEVRKHVPDILERISNNFKILVCAYTHFQVFLSPYSKYISRNPSFTGKVYAWQFTSEKASFISFLEDLTEGNRFLNSSEIEKRAERSLDIQLFLELLPLRLKKEDMINFIDNQLLSASKN